MNVRKYKFWAVLVLLLVLGLLFVAFGPKWPEHPASLAAHPHWSSFLYLAINEILPKVGDALIIAFIISAAVDRFAKEQLLEEFAKDISTHMIGKDLPHELRNHINGYYLTVDVVRRHLELDFELKELPDSDLVELTTTMTSDLYNYSYKKVSEPIYVYVDDSFDPDSTKARFMEVRVDDFIYREGDDQAGEDVKGLQKTKAAVTFEVAVDLPAREEHREPHSKRCFVKIVQRFARADDSSFVATYPTIGVAVTFQAPPDYESSIDVSYMRDPSKAVTEHHIPTRKAWKLKDPLLKGQGLFVRWSKRPPHDQPTVDKPASD